MFAEWQAGRRVTERTAEHERSLCDRHLGIFKGQKVQKISASDVARVLRSMRDDGLSEWTCSAVYRIAKAVFSLGVRRGILTRNPVDGLTPAERPKQRNARKVERLDSATLRRLIAAAPTERWRAGLALAGLGGLRLGELRGLQWGDVDLQANTIAVSRSVLRDGTPKPPKTDAGVRIVPLFPELRQLLLTWKLRSPFTDPDDYVLVTAARGPVQQRNAQRTFANAKAAAGLDSLEGRLSWHSLRHSGRLGLAYRVRPSRHDRERDDGPREPVVHARLLRARPPRHGDDGRGRAGTGSGGRNLTTTSLSLTAAVKRAADLKQKSPDYRGFLLRDEEAL